jgi:hypothetical protein
MSNDTAPAPIAMTVHASLDGWPVDLAFSLPPARLGVALAKLTELGYTPRQDAPQPTPVSAASAGPPCCPLHGTAKVKESERRPGTYFCAAKMGDGSYCKERPV